MKKPDLGGTLLRALRALPGSVPAAFRSGPAFAAAGAFAVTLLVVLTNIPGSSGDDLGAFEVGKVAETDVVAEQDLAYEDEEATRLKREERKRAVAGVFRYSADATREAQERWEVFSRELAAVGAVAGTSPEPGEALPGAGTIEKLLDYAATVEERVEILGQAGAVLRETLEGGIFLLPDDLSALNPAEVELIRHSEDRTEREILPRNRVVTLADAAAAAETRLVEYVSGPAAARLALDLLTPFLRENVFYSPEETAQRLAEAAAAVEPEMRYISRGKRVIKKGFVITEEEMKDLRALNRLLPGSDGRDIAARGLLLLLLFCFLVYYTGWSLGKTLTSPEAYLLCALAAFYVAGASLAQAGLPQGITLGADAMPVSLVMPTALAVMITGILLGPALALTLAFALPLGAFFTGAFDGPALTFAVVSGVAAAFSLRGAEKRMDLLRAGLVIAAVNALSMTAGLLGQRAAAGTYPQALFWAAFNGVASGMLVLGVLPPLENALNAATAFRLIELSDLNAPILKKLFAAAPGTYSHSIMVANLAEAACQDIGANALLARVGAYYHDLGKMENAGYFVENQTGANPHDGLAPRMSATIIRSHVRLGQEKARAQKFPRQVVDIIGEHHGNSVMAFFYDKARKLEGDAARREDFSYPGTPPRSRESAVVMLADTVQAAIQVKIRSQDKATSARLEDWIQELFTGKVESGQLAASDLTFRDLETIKRAFVKVLLGQYHSRIDYPKLGKGAEG